MPRSSLSCFLPWFSVPVASSGSPLGGMLEGVSMGASSNAFQCTEGVIAFLAALVTAAVIPLSRAGVTDLQPKVQLLLPLGSAAAGVVCMLIFLGRGGGGSMGLVSAGKILWFYIALLVMCIALVQAFRRFQAGSHGSQPGA